MRAKVRPRHVRHDPRAVNLAIAMLTLLALSAASCTKWTHPAKGEREYNTDDALCKREGEKSAETHYWSRYHVYKACMIERGWDPK